jgi:hypothetical protein
MSHFTDYLLHRLTIREVSELFPRSAMNALFAKEIRRVLPRVEHGIQRDDLVSLLDYDFVGYMDASMRSAGFGETERDALVHDLVVKLLVSPGGLVSRWKMDTLLSYRFKRAVKNAVITLGQKQARYRRRSKELPDDHVARPRDEDDLVGGFREWLRDRLGEVAVRVFDARLAGEDVKGLVGTPLVPTSYALKKVVQQIKASAVTWAGSDPEFLQKVRRMMAMEDETLARRFGREQAAVAG